MTNKIDRLVSAMVEYEGWYPLGDARNVRGSKSYRHHNPGNLRASPFSIGSEGNYAIFNNCFDGMSAMKWDILQKARGNTITNLNGNSTLRDLIFVWAPPGDNNNSENYLKHVLTRTGFLETMKLSELLSQGHSKEIS